MWCQSWVETTHVSATSKTNRAGVIRGMRDLPAHAGGPRPPGRNSPWRGATRGSATGRPTTGRCGPRNVPDMQARNIVLGRLAICAGKIRAATCRKIHFSVMPAQLVFRRDPRAEGDHVVVEERVAGLDRRIHGDAVALGDHQETGQHDLVADVERLVERMPALDAVVGDVEVGVGTVIAQPLPHVARIERRLGLGDQLVKVLLSRADAADGLLGGQTQRGGRRCCS